MSNLTSLCYTLLTHDIHVVCSSSIPLSMQMLSCLEHMYHDLGLVKDFNINPITLKRWLVGLTKQFSKDFLTLFDTHFVVLSLGFSY